MRRSDSDATVWVLLGLLLAARAGHWFITPSRHPHASPWTYAGTWLQVAIGLGMVVFGWIVYKRDEDDVAPDAARCP